MPIANQDLGRAVKQLQYRHYRTMDRAMREIGSSLAQWDALRAIARKPGASAHALAELTFQTDQSFGALASRLVKAGLVERVAGPGRAIRHRLTPVGEAILEKGYPLADRVVEDSLAPLTAGQREELYNLIYRALTEGRPPQRVGF